LPSCRSAAAIVLNRAARADLAALGIRGRPAATLSLEEGPLQNLEVACISFSKGARGPAEVPPAKSRQSHDSFASFTKLAGQAGATNQSPFEHCQH
jgi:hypothetical protein